MRYVLEGSVRKASDRIRVTAQLVEAHPATTCGPNVHDDVADIFALQDRIVTHVVGAIAPRLKRAEIDRIKNAATDDLDSL